MKTLLFTPFIASIDLQKLFNQLVFTPKEPLLFSSGLFLFLFLGFMGVYYILHANHRAKITFVTVFSIYFYYKSSGIYFVILIISTFVDYYLANRIFIAQKNTERKIYLIISLVLNLGLLGYFKYTNFLFELFYSWKGQPFEPFSIFLPVGISFFTFQSLSYTIDIYRKEIEPVKNVLDYAFFVSFFPQLVAGPIVRAVDFIPQIYKPTLITPEMLGRGLFLIGSGLFKKAVIADYISINFVDRVFDTPLLYSGVENLMALYGYALQIYCDFSGYSDMAIGIALLLGFEFTINFNSPYQAQNITDFWRCWHISLSTWLKDYLYISLGGNRKGKYKTYRNLLITMILGGLWHGAAFRFILWGALHGGALAIHKAFLELWGEKKFLTSKYTSILATVLTFHWVCLCWIFFRAENMTIAQNMLQQIIFHFNGAIFGQFLRGYAPVLGVMCVGYFLHFIPKTTENNCIERFIKLSLAKKVAILLVVILVVTQVKSSEIQPFIYFQF